MVLSARSTLNVLKADTLPRSTNSVTYLQQAGRQKHKNRHTQKGMTTLNNKPTQRDRKMEIQQETERGTVETGQVGRQQWRFKLRYQESEIRYSKLCTWYKLEKYATLSQTLMQWSLCFTNLLPSVSSHMVSSLKWAEAESNQENGQMDNVLETCLKNVANIQFTVTEDKEIQQLGRVGVFKRTQSQKCYKLKIIQLQSKQKHNYIIRVEENTCNFMNLLL